MRTVVVALVAVCALAVSAEAQSKKARRTLSLLQQVDGAGSGLDADTVRGLTPEQIVAQAVGATGRALADYIRDNDYARTTTIPVLNGFCACVPVVRCDPGDFPLDCGGEASLTTGFLTKVAQLETEKACEVCGCASGGPASLAATLICLDLTP